MVCLRGYANRTAAWLVKDIWKSLPSQQIILGINVLCGTLWPKRRHIDSQIFGHVPFSGCMDMLYIDWLVYSIKIDLPLWSRGDVIRPSTWGSAGVWPNCGQSASVTLGSLKKWPETTNLPEPTCAMYGIFTYIWVLHGVNIGKYSIHGASGEII